MEAPISSDDDPLGPGHVVGGWRIDALLGRGGTSTVFSIVDDTSGRRAALKVMLPAVSFRPGATERFFLEAHVLAEIGHPGVPRIFDRGRLPDGRVYLVMERLHGRTLADVMAHGRVPLATALAILDQLCDLLAAAHRRGVIHRDVKPSNIFVDAEREPPLVKLMDWGIAKLTGAQDETGALTSTGAIIGTPRYLAPEQARAQVVDARTDVYSLGVVAYELLLGAYPFESESVAEALMMQMVQPPPSPRRFWPDIPEDLDWMLRAMLAKDPARRPSLDFISATVRGLAAAQPADATPDSMRTGAFDHDDTIEESPRDRATRRVRPLRR